jgi:hypothetical protein
MRCLRPATALNPAACKLNYKPRDVASSETVQHLAGHSNARPLDSLRRSYTELIDLSYFEFSFSNQLSSVS